MNNVLYAKYLDQILTKWKKNRSINILGKYLSKHGQYVLTGLRLEDLLKIRISFFGYMFMDIGIVVGSKWDDPPLMKTRKEIIIDEVMKDYQKLITAWWQVTEPKC